MQTDARTAILARVRNAIGTGGGEVSAEWIAISRDFRRSSTCSVEELRRRFIERLQDYDAQVLESSVEAIPASLARMIRARRHSRLLIPQGFPEAMLPPGFDFVPENGLTYDDMTRCDGILTQSTLAIAETGTIVLQNLPGQGRRAASLLPDYHLCVVEASRIVATVPEAFAQLQATAHLPTTFISGPSATADIEMTRIKGVHGPRFLDVTLVS